MTSTSSLGRVVALAAILIGLPFAATAAEAPPIPLYAAPLPAGANPERTDTLPGKGLRFIRNVSQPSVTAFLPDPAKATGAAVIVAPGGAFMMLSYDSEGVLVAQKLAERGIAAFVLKYRLEQTPDALPLFMAELGKRMKAATPATAETPRLPPFPTEALAAEDAATAVRLVRGRAADWKIDPKRIGFVGFSAGAITASNIATGEASGRPDFVGIIYGSLGRPVPKDAPPAFIATAADDRLLADAAVPMFNAWRAAGRPAELHMYERGGHGFGMPPQGSSSDHWLDEFVWWMEARGLLKAAK
ncbi:MAG: alpha/beta hydrolase [Alphaproteobacteria bacterium]|nr:alpha/beta hydrolase [Alphaproteobacteria bacterium]MBU1516761.1 alpha/beta hydrolase [Alphaproteobacteria bacterium]MBU2092455.1 alpha/beta hydrolase [Alphaproteobacteria bacterium]MBU2152414.1 alpha/beta hydrolase [Alphaproteobacteria bacterium]MBU2305625.1 alpha/beta hydrolase [Alphaproteobacteria bacterium]